MLSRRCLTWILSTAGWMYVLFFCRIPLKSRNTYGLRRFGCLTWILLTVSFFFCLGLGWRSFRFGLYCQVPSTACNQGTYQRDTLYANAPSPRISSSFHLHTFRFWSSQLYWLVSGSYLLFVICEPAERKNHTATHIHTEMVSVMAASGLSAVTKQYGGWISIL